MTRMIWGTLAALALAAPAFAGGENPVVIYPYATSQNFCPAGLQPVTFDGTVSCGRPTTQVTYQQAKGGGYGYRYSGSRHCQAGTKGC